MKRFILNKFTFCLYVLCIAFALSSCNRDDCNNVRYSVERNMAFILQTNTRSNVVENLKIADKAISRSLNVRLSDIAQENKEYSLVPDASVLDEYNKRTGSLLKMLPSDSYSLSSTSLKIAKGSSISDPLTYTIQPLSKEMLSSGNSWALAFKLKSKDGKVLQGANAIIISLEPVIITTCPVLGTFKYKYHGAHGTAEQTESLKQWTIEMRVNMNGFSMNNQALFGNWGENSEIYIRFGDAGTPFNTLQVKFGKAGQFDKSNTVFVPNTWYHIAVVYDGTKCTLYVNGVKDLDTDKPAGTVFNLGKEFWVCSSGANYFRNACMMSELRVWNVARTVSQLTSNQYGVSPSSPGLIHYWKMNEGQGYTLHDAVSKNKADLLVRNGDNKKGPLQAPVWAGNIRSDDQGRTNFEDLP